jgi:glyoxalase family protein
MKLGGLHHITMITGDARKNVEFYADVLGLRMVKKTVNFDAPETYHLYFGDEKGTPGSILTWFEFPGAPQGRPGTGMIHTIQLAVASQDALAFWEERLQARGSCARSDLSLRFEDYDGLGFDLLIPETPDPPLRAEHPEIPAEHAISGIEGARAYAPGDGVADELLTAALDFVHVDEGQYRLEGEHREFRWAYDPPPHEAGGQGAGTVHHIAWASRDEDHLSWQERVRAAGRQVTDVRDRDYFQSIYFREPSGVLFEIATLSPGFAVDEDPEHLGEELRLPKQHEHLRAHLEDTLTPVENPRAARRAGSRG